MTDSAIGALVSNLPELENLDLRGCKQVLKIKLGVTMRRYSVSFQGLFSIVRAGWKMFAKISIFLEAV